MPILSHLFAHAKHAAVVLALCCASAGVVVAQQQPLVVHNAARFIDVALDAQAAQQARDAKARREAAARVEDQAGALSQASRSAHAAKAAKNATAKPPGVKPAPRFGPIDRSSCYNSCAHGLCKRTLASGHVETWQAPRRFDEALQHWYWDTRTNACGIANDNPVAK